MATTYKVLGQSKPLAATLTSLYTVPVATQTVCSSISVANQSAMATSFRISIAKAGAADDPSQFLYFDTPLPGNNTFVVTIGITLASTDVIRVYATLATLSFNAFGSELT